ncbi:DUF6538 domain-containing protein [Halocynthiibacter styelae]|uniref:DUF6538 domain-containing protein n=1 Tax=Halocynthiibacter styelae TaxID=2761955 RepID=UPI00374296C0
MRRKTWFIRVQVPKEMQESVGRKEFCRSLKTTSHREAIARAPDVTAEIRTEIENLYYRSQQTRRTITRLTDRE